MGIFECVASRTGVDEWWQWLPEVNLEMEVKKGNEMISMLIP